MSGLVFPGAGQLWFKQYLKGGAFVLAVSASMAVIVMKAVHQALAILEKAEAEGGAIDMVAIMNSASRASATANDLSSCLALTALVVCWIASVVDAYLVGRKLDLAEQGKRPADGKRGVSP